MCDTLPPYALPGYPPRPHLFHGETLQTTFWGAPLPHLPPPERTTTPATPTCGRQSRRLWPTLHGHMSRQLLERTVFENHQTSGGAHCTQGSGVCLATGSPPYGDVWAVTCVVLVGGASAQQAAHAGHKRERKACQEPKRPPPPPAPGPMIVRLSQGFEATSSTVWGLQDAGVMRLPPPPPPPPTALP